MHTQKPLLIVVIARGKAGDANEFGRYDLSSWPNNTNEFSGELGMKCGINTRLNDRVYVLRPLVEKDNVAQNFGSDIFLDQESKFLFIDRVSNFLQTIQSKIGDKNLNGWELNEADISEYDICLLIHWGGGNDISLKANENAFRSAMEELNSEDDDYWHNCFMVSISSLRKDIIDVSGGIRIPVGEELRELINRAKSYTDGEIENIEKVKVDAFKDRYTDEVVKGTGYSVRFIEKCRRLSVIREEA